MLLWSYDVTKKKTALPTELPTAYRLMLTALCIFELKSYAVMELRCYKEKTTLPTELPTA